MGVIIGARVRPYEWGAGLGNPGGGLAVNGLVCGGAGGREGLESSRPMARCSVFTAKLALYKKCLRDLSCSTCQATLLWAKSLTEILGPSRPMLWDPYLGAIRMDNSRWQ